MHRWIVVRRGGWWWTTSSDDASYRLSYRTSYSTGRALSPDVEAEAGALSMERRDKGEQSAGRKSTSTASRGVDKDRSQIFTLHVS